MGNVSEPISDLEKQVALEEKTVAGLRKRLGIGIRRANTILDELGIKEKAQRTDDRGDKRRDYGPLWPLRRAFVLKRDDNKCQYENCGNTHCEENPLSVHHIKPWESFPRTEEGQQAAHHPYNLISLCQSHHRMADGGTIVIDVEDLKRRTDEFIIWTLNC